MQRKKDDLKNKMKVVDEKCRVGAESGWRGNEEQVE